MAILHARPKLMRFESLQVVKHGQKGLLIIRGFPFSPAKIHLASIARCPARRGFVKQKKKKIISVHGTVQINCDLIGNF